MNKVKKLFNKLWTYDIFHTFCYSFILVVIIECMNRRGFGGIIFPLMHPVIFLYNLLIVMTTMSIALFFKRRGFAYGVIALVWLGLSVTNFIILTFRKTPFTAMDFYLISDAIKIAGIYIGLLHIIGIILGVVAVVFLMTILWKKTNIIETAMTKTRFYLYATVQTLIVFLMAYGMFATLVFSNVVEAHYGNLAQAYKKYGFCHCFIISVLDRGIRKSNDYSPEYMENMKYELDDKTTEANEDTPNFVFVQLESFFDPSLLNGVTFSEEPIPNFKKLYTDYTSGFLSVPVFGAGTCNTEFEVQTGINLDDFGPGEYPYRTIMKSTVCESMAYDLKKLGYSTHAIHNNDATFYDRYTVFSHLGYDTFTSIEFMQNIEKTPTGWAKDMVLVEGIEKALDSTEGTDYVYAISVQGHGDYPTTYPEGYTPKIKVSGFGESEKQTAFEYYVNQIHEMDEMIGELVNMLSARKDRTVLVMYGDHLPTFDINDESLANKDKFQTQYVMWSNFEMEKMSLDLESYQLSAYVMDRFSISEGYIMKYHQLKHTDDKEEYLKNLKILEYDILYGKKEIYGGEVPYQPTNIKLGIDNIEIFDVYNFREYVCVAGTGFTEYSKILINNKEYETELISDKLIRTKDVVIKPGDYVSVAVKGEDKVELERCVFMIK